MNRQLRDALAAEKRVLEWIKEKIKRDKLCEQREERRLESSKGIVPTVARGNVGEVGSREGGVIARRSRTRRKDPIASECK